MVYREISNIRSSNNSNYLAQVPAGMRAMNDSSLERPFYPCQERKKTVSSISRVGFLSWSSITVLLSFQRKLKKNLKKGRKKKSTTSLLVLPLPPTMAKNQRDGQKNASHQGHSTFLCSNRRYGRFILNGNAHTEIHTDGHANGKTDGPILEMRGGL